MHGVLVNRLGGLSLPRKSVVRLTDRPDMTLDVYRGRKTTMQLFSGLYLEDYFMYKAVTLAGGIREPLLTCSSYKCCSLRRNFKNADP